MAANLRLLRERRGWTQARVAQLAGMPRATVANAESGGANPTLNVLAALSDALHVSIEELLAAPRHQGRLYKAAELNTRSRGGVVVRKLLPDPLPAMELERFELPAGSRMRGVPHTPGTREYLTCEAGVVEIALHGEVWRLAPGDVFVFRGDQRHSYHNPGDVEAIGYSAVLLTGSRRT